MPITRPLALSCFLAVVSAAACGGGAPPPEAGVESSAVITVDGSSTVFPVTEAVAEEFQREHKGTRITVGISGTGGGFQKFCRDEIDIADASRPITPVRSRGLRQGRRRVHRAAGRLRRPGGRREPEEHLGDLDDGRRAQEAVGAGRAGQGHALEPDPRRVARPRDSPVRRRRRLRHVRLLHRGHRRQGRRRAAATTPRARTTTSSSRA